MNYPQHQPSYQPPPAPVAKAKRWPWILGIVAPSACRPPQVKPQPHRPRQPGPPPP